MGVVASRAIRARQRSTVEEIERRVAVRDQPETARRDQRIQAAKRDGRRALRARAAAEQAKSAAEVKAGTALCRLVDQGLSLGDAAVLLVLTRSAAKRLVRTAKDAAVANDPTPSTGSAGDSATGDLDAHRQDSSTPVGGATNEEET